MADAKRHADNHRFYENEFPAIEELVLAKITRIETMGAYAELLEYGNKEGMLLLSELSKRRFRSVNKLIRVGRVEYVMVIRVDQEKGYIDLSKKRVDNADIPAVEERYSKSKKTHLIVKHVNNQFPDFSVETIYKEVIWPLFHKYPHALDGLVVCLEDPAKAFEHVDHTKIPQELLDAIVEDIELRMSPPNSKMRATFDVSCIGYDGVEAVKAAIAKGVTAANEIFDGTEEEKNDLTVCLISPPRFIATCTDKDKERGVLRINTLMEKTKEAICAEDGGDFRVFEEVFVYGEEDEPAKEEEDSEETSDSESESESDIEGMGVAVGDEEEEE